MDSLVGRIRLEPTSRGPLHAQLTEALGALVNEGWLRRQRGAKTVVSSGPPADPVIERRLGSFYAFAWELEARGREPHSQLLARSTILADAR
ncbi:MAG TPA: hypothetical protein VK898_04035, partial [Chloroflexota bacterium]|nr:hypothetical protein [Chloroflexota bacterium]